MKIKDSRPQSTVSIFLRSKRVLMFDRRLGICTVIGILAFTTGCSFLAMQLVCAGDYLISTTGIDNTSILTEVKEVCGNTNTPNICILIIIAFSSVMIVHFWTTRTINLCKAIAWISICMFILLITMGCTLSYIFYVYNTPGTSSEVKDICSESRVFHMNLFVVNIILVSTTFKFCVLKAYETNIQKV